MSASDDLFDHPGYLGLTSEGVVLIHADWPAYAIGHDWKYGLVNLGQFPPRTRFTLIDDIDQCFLFVVPGRKPIAYKFDDKLFHVALWHEDVLDLFHRGYLAGGSLKSYRDWAVRAAKELEGLIKRLVDEAGKGVYGPVPIPSPDHYTDVEAVRGLLSDDGMKLTASGLAVLDKVLLEEKQLIAPEIQSRTHGLLPMRQYDTAVREACILVEDALRKFTGSTAFGLKLVEEFFQRAGASKRLIPARLKVFRTEVRTAFKFVRNEYMHNLREISEAQCYAILVRISSVYTGVKEIESVLCEGDG
jgi:hypothetical protein